MDANRWFYLRHPEGFSAERFACVEAGFHIWAATITATLEMWSKIPSYAKVERPTYEFAPAELSSDQRRVTLPLGGDPRNIGLKLFEDDFPQDFTKFLPLWFRVDLELGRRDTFGWFPDARWDPAYSPEQRAQLRASPMFARPPDGA